MYFVVTFLRKAMADPLVAPLLYLIRYDGSQDAVSYYMKQYNESNMMFKFDRIDAFDCASKCLQDNHNIITACDSILLWGNKNS